MGVIRETQQYNLISPENGRVGYQSNKGMPQYESIQQYSAISPEDRYRGYQWKVTPQYESTQQCNVLSIEDDFNGTHVETTKRNIFFRNFLMPLGCFDCLDDILLFSLFRDDADLERTGFHFNGGEQVEVEVKVCDLSRLLSM